MSAALNRRNLDRLAISCGGRVALGCTKHPDDGATVIYQDGDLRLVCPTCGFEAARVKVADNEEKLREALERICDEADHICSRMPRKAIVTVFADDLRTIARAALREETP